MRNLTLNNEHNVGTVLFVVEGQKTEFFLLHRIFTRIFNFKFQSYNRMGKYYKVNDGYLESSIFVINTEESAISYINNTNQYLDELFVKLINDYHFPVDRAAIYYLFDRDIKSNTDSALIEQLLKDLSNSRDNAGFGRQGLLLLSYPAIEAFVAMNFLQDAVQLEFEKGADLKVHLSNEKLYQHKISSDSIVNATAELLAALDYMGTSFDIDDMEVTNIGVFRHQEAKYLTDNTFRLISMLSVLFLDLGLIEIED